MKYTNKGVGKLATNGDLDELKKMMLQSELDSLLPTLLYVARKLGELEGIMSNQREKADDLTNIHNDFNRLFNTLVMKAGIDFKNELETKGIGGDV